MQKLGNIFFTNQGVRAILGWIEADMERGVRPPAVRFDPAALLPVCRAAKVREICAVCYPWDDIAHPPFLDHVIQYTKLKTPQRVGRVKTCEKNNIAKYLVWLDCEVIQQRWGLVYLHLHEPTPAEIDVEMKERRNEQG